MPIPFELANIITANQIDPTSVIVGRSFYYSDASPQFSKSVMGGSLVETDSEAVQGQIEIVIGTPIGTEEHEPTFGCDAIKRLFDNLTQSNLNAMELEILTALRTWLSDRLDFYAVNITKESDLGNVIVVVPFMIKVSGVQKTYIGNLSNIAKFSLAA